MTQLRTRGRARIAVVVPFSNTNLEPDMTMLCPPGVSVHFARAGGYDLDAIPDERQMRRYSDTPFEEVVDSLLGSRPNVLLYGCTSATLAQGPEFDADFRRRIEAHGAVPVVTAACAVIEALEDLGVRRFAFGSPYVRSLNDLAVSFIEACGFRCVGRADTSAPLGNDEVAALTPEDVTRIAREADCAQAEAIVLSCTDMRAAEAVPDIEARLGKPVVTSNQAMMYAAVKRLGISPDECALQRHLLVERGRESTKRPETPQPCAGAGGSRRAGVSTPVRAALAGLPAYALAVQDVPGVERVIQLGQNELGVAPSPRAIEAAARATGALNRYPDVEHERLRRAIAEAHGLRPERVLCGAGSMDLMGLLATTYCEPGVDVVVTRFGYKYFELQCTIAGATLRVAPESLAGVDADAVLDAVTDRTGLVYVVNPGNPTGTCLKAGDLARLRAHLPDRVMLVVDAAYGEFAAGAEYETGFDLVDAERNVVVLRTFSKAYGLAGLRIGWLYAPDGVVDAVARVRPPNAITPVGLAAAEAALRDREHLERVVRDVARLREAFRRHVRALGLEAGPSHGNFVLVRFPEDGPIDAGEAFERLKNAGIIVRPTGGYALPDCLRVTIGSADEMAAVSGALERIVATPRDSETLEQDP